MGAACVHNLESSSLRGQVSIAFRDLPDSVEQVFQVKADKDMTSEAVQGKREAALRWSNHVSDSPEVEATWRYLIVSETNIHEARELAGAQARW